MEDILYKNNWISNYWIRSLFDKLDIFQWSTLSDKVSMKRIKVYLPLNCIFVWPFMRIKELQDVFGHFAINLIFTKKPTFHIINTESLSGKRPKFFFVHFDVYFFEKFNFSLNFIKQTFFGEALYSIKLWVSTAAGSRINCCIKLKSFVFSI